ncbi:MAG: dethiobiotin synthase [Acidobacteriota bacterium]|nr:dethiobiotin synthase [Acidobacteriota bacterium]MDE3170532.1 dethiobiotin synthase [Acidobacteriota bacterium]
MPSRFFVTGTDTGIGKTVVSALLCAALDAIYWKPIQTGSRDGTDRRTVMRLAELPRSRTRPESYIFAPPVSPHLAARLAGAQIELRKIKLPEVSPQQNLIAEGAGGVLVPINHTQLMTDVIRHLGLPVLLASRTSLGTINHTLLSLAALRDARIDVRGVILVGRANPENRRAIEHYGQIAVVGWLPLLKKLDKHNLLAAYKSHFDRKALER